MGGTPVTPAEKAKFLSLLQNGYTIKEAASQINRSYAWAKEFVQATKLQTPQAVVPNILPTITGPKNFIDLSDVARDCLDDFGRFRARFMGRLSSPWQENAADHMRILLDSPHKEYVVVNCPPGSGKSTLFTHDIPAWLTCRSRSIRGFVGSSTQKLANQYVRRLRGAFERTIPMQAKSEDLMRGLARDADSTLVHDYGLFKPDYAERIPWSMHQFTVLQLGETPTDEKECTWAAYGMDAEFLGWRVNFIVWDDLVTYEICRNIERIEAQQRWWHDEAETRLEPGGLLILQGQRLKSNDLYRYCLDLKTGEESLDEHLIEIGEEELPRETKYHHIIYKAHYDEICKAAEDPSVHSITAAPYREDGTGGCLLDPARLSWRELRSVMARPFSNYRVVYQQEDVDPTEVLVPKLWVDGGRGDDGIEYPGCWDKDRALAQIPKHLPPGTRLSLVTADPSPTKFWAVQWWLYVQPDWLEETGTGLRYLLDLERKPMDAPDLLDWHVATNGWTGLLEDWWRRSHKLNCPFTHLVIENNAAQRFIYQYEFFRRWLQYRSVNLVPHATNRNKADPDYGVGTLKPHYRFGRTRLPGFDIEARRQSGHLVTEITTYPEGSYDDNVMANWFMEYQLQFLVDSVDEQPSVYDDIPSWARTEPLPLRVP